MVKIKYKTGRPPTYKTVEEMEVKIEDYFNVTDVEDYTVTGLSLHLGFTSRQALDNYQGKAEFVDSIKKAKQMVEHSYELDLKRKGNTGTIFALKNFDWKDKSESEVYGKNGEAFQPGVVNIYPPDNIVSGEGININKDE